MNRIITYMIDKETGVVWSRVGTELAIPMLDWEAMTPENGFKATYVLEKTPMLGVDFRTLIPTKKIPLKLKNKHRKFWGMKPLKEKVKV